MKPEILCCPFCSTPMIENIEHDFICPKCKRYCYGNHHVTNNRISQEFGRKPKRIKKSLFNRKISSGEYDY